MSDNTVDPFARPYTFEQQSFAIRVMHGFEDEMEERKERGEEMEPPYVVYGESLKAIIEYDKFRTQQIEDLNRQVAELVNLLPGPVHLPQPKGAR
jgi:hypothetical protein